MKTVVIDRQKWTRGYQRTYAHPCHHCVGAYLGQAFTHEDLQKWYATPAFYEIATKHYHAALQLVVLNDSPNLTDEEREEQLIELVKPMGYTLTFIN